MLAFLRENIVFILSSIFIVAGVVTVSAQGRNIDAPIVPVSGNTQNTTQVPTPATTSPSTTLPLTPTARTIVSKPAIRDAGNNEDESSDD
ncbi:hypothetical protein HKL94_00985 [Candidatus Parcubacteria bacterium]|nr:hypothetical protein [Candidatus Parcubacteria bacterium]